MLSNQFNWLADPKIKEEISDGVQQYRERGVPERAVRVTFSRDRIGLRYKLYVEMGRVPPSMRYRLRQILKGISPVTDYLDLRDRARAELAKSFRPRKVEFPLLGIEVARSFAAIPTATEMTSHPSNDIIGRSRELRGLEIIEDDT